ncbi:M23 family metallopeptidase [Vallitalea longa]|nr:M23 family metallopeptidase [Vallitalea longa]
MKNTIFRLLIVIFIIAFFNSMLLEKLYNREDKLKYIQIKTMEEAERIAEFNVTDESIKEIKAYCDTNDIDFIEFFSSYMKYNNYEVDSVSYDYNEEYYQGVNDIDAVKKLYSMVLSDIQYFPIPKNKKDDSRNYWYCNSWLADRSYGGERKHYGTDIMDTENERGYFPIVSMTDGKVEKIGWLELGGWRIGIRAEHGGYFYYAHLDKYAKGIKKGSSVKAGDIIGYMGDSGYGEEGTCGKFEVHLHLGISLPIEYISDEFWINPYWILRYMEDSKITKSF